MAQDACRRDSTPRGIVVTVLGLLQIPAWGSTFYLLAVLAKPIADGNRLGLRPHHGRARARASGRRRGVAAGRPHDRALRRPRGDAVRRGVARRRPGGDRHRAEFRRLSRRLGHRRRRHGRGALQFRLCHARRALRPVGAQRDHRGDSFGRLRQHGVLATQRVFGRAFRLARCVPDLCGMASVRRPAALSDRHSDACVAAARPTHLEPRRPRRRCCRTSGPSSSCSPQC